jgi:ribose transport system ATP-binding protein
MTDDDDIVVRMVGVSKSYGGIRALKDVSFEARRGEIHALLGENGAGKSTILKILRGVETPDGGSITVKGQAHAGLTPQFARALGIAMIFQEMSLVPTLTVAQNIFLASEPTTGLGLIDDRAMRRRAAEVFRAMGVAVDPRAMVADISTGEQQLTEIAKALVQDADVLILDEPTSALTAGEVDVLFDLLRRLRDAGRTIIYVSHRMDEIFRIADRATVFRDGRFIDSRPIGAYTLPTLIADIMGRAARDLSEFSTRSATGGEVVLDVRDLGSRSRGGSASFALRKGEVLGIAGLLGSGRSRLARMLFGLEPVGSGEIRVRGRPVSIGTPEAAKALKMALVPEDRRREGLILQHTVQANIELPILSRLGRGLFVDRRTARSTTDQLIRRLAIKTAGPLAPAVSLSGGNQQKIVIGKWLATEPEVLILDEPTAGIDIGSKGEVLRLVRELAAEGRSILFISSELAELVAVSDRIAVMQSGRIVETVERSDLVAAAPGGAPAAGAEQRLQFILQQGGRHA